MGVGDTSPSKVDHLEQRGPEVGVIEISIVKDSAPDSADGKVATFKVGKRQIHIVRHTVDGHMVKIGCGKKVWRKAVFHRMIKKGLTDNFQRALRVIVPHIVAVLLSAHFGIT